MPSKRKEDRIEYKRVRATAKSLEEVRQVKPLEPSPGRVTAEVQADRVRRAVWGGALAGRPGPEHRAGGVR